MCEIIVGKEGDLQEVEEVANVYARAFTPTTCVTAIVFWREQDDSLQEASILLITFFL